MDPVPTTADPMGGKLSVEINSVVIPAFMLGSVSANVTQLLRTSERLSGTTTTPTNQLDNPSFDIVFFPNTWKDLQYFFPDNVDGESIVFGGSDCAIPDSVPVVLHYDCDDGTTRDINLPVTKVSFEDNGERNATDDLSVTIHLYPQPNALGQVIYGPIPAS